jgi:hypothetical protein
MSSILEKLTADLKRRQKVLRADKNSFTYVLKDLDAEKLIIDAFSTIIESVSNFNLLVDMAVKIGRSIQQKNHFLRDDLQACQLGWFVFVSYVELGLFKFRRKTTKKLRHPPYFPEIRKNKLVEELWYLLKDKEPDLFPSPTMPEPWTKSRHPLGFTAVKKVSPDILKLFSPEKQPVFFKALNKLGSQGWLVNTLVLNVLDYFIENKKLSSPVNFEEEPDERRKTSKTIETESIAKMANHFRDKVFFHLYNADFRGRLYANTSWLHEQSSDTAKGLLLLAEPTPLGTEGLFWLYVHIANCWGKDKLPLNDRVSFTESKLEELMSFAENPVENTGWFDSEKPWSLLAAAFEIKLISEFEGPVEEYLCHLPVFIDGTVSGTQHLVAMSKDEELASFVNLVPTEEPGDLYSKVAELVWNKLDKLVSELDQGTLKRFDEIYNASQELELAYVKASYPSQEKTDAWHELAKWQNHNRAIREKLFPVFWSRVTDLKERRKVVKRVSMTLGG